MTENELLTTLSEEEYEEIIKRYGSLSEYIKDQTFKYKKETTKELDKVKMLFFASLIAGVSYEKFKDKLQKSFEKGKVKIDKQTEKGYLEVVRRISGENSINTLTDKEQRLNKGLYALYKQFELDMKSTKTADDKFVRVISNYYLTTSKTYQKEWVDKEEYLKKAVGRYDKQEKVVAYRNKNGSIRAYFDIASYDSMVYNTNLTNTGVQESIRDAIRREWDVAYIDPHMNSCPLCQEFQGRFISLTGESVGQIFNGQIIRDTLEDAQRNGFLHPNCTHVPRKAYEWDSISNKYTGPEYVHNYEIKQKENALNLKKSRLKTDIKIYEELNNQEMVDKTKQKVKSINKEIKKLKTSA